METFADDTAILASHANPMIANAILQNLNKISNWLKRWRIKVNETKSVHITFIMNRGTCLPVSLNNIQVPQADVVRYAPGQTPHMEELYIYETETAWNATTQIVLDAKQKIQTIPGKQNIAIQMHYKASLCNIEIIQRFQSKILRVVVNAPWFITNEILHHDIQISTVREEATRFIERHMDRLNLYPNSLANQLMKSVITRILKRRLPQDLLSDKNRKD